MKYLVLLLAFCACDNREDINCKYQGAVVYDWHSNSIPSHRVLRIKHKGQFIDVAVYQIDEDYKVGDTINKPCIQ